MVKLRENTNMLWKIVLTFLVEAKMPLKYCQEAFTHATFIINKLASHVIEIKTPFELLYQCKSNYLDIKVFGCECYPFLRPYNKHKVDFYTAKCILLGISITNKEYVACIIKVEYTSLLVLGSMKVHFHYQMTLISVDKSP